MCKDQSHLARVLVQVVDGHLAQVQVFCAVDSVGTGDPQGQGRVVQGDLGHQRIVLVAE